MSQTGHKTHHLQEQISLPESIVIVAKVLDCDNDDFSKDT
jgi:hypothetical protein